MKGFGLPLLLVWWNMRSVENRRNRKVAQVWSGGQHLLKFTSGELYVKREKTRRGA